MFDRKAYMKEYKKKYYAENREKLIAYSAEFQKEYRKNNRDVYRKSAKRMYNKNVLVKRKVSREYKEKFPDRSSAHKKVRAAVNNGLLVKPDKCEKCKDNSCKINAHHEDYSQPLNVEWLCASCHMKLHSQRRNP